MFATFNFITGGCDDTLKLHRDGKLKTTVDPNVEPEESYDYDLIVIGGGSGGLAASKVCNALVIIAYLCMWFFCFFFAFFNF